ncbi:MAG TPA: sugar transferase [Clostridiales bacterium]|nr:sugar transferase [Clostridiales bacterium]
MKTYLFVKRAMDIFFALFLLLVASPIMLAVAVAIKLESDGPVIFTQPRCGKNGAIFNVYKFRTMICETERNGVPLRDSERVTRVGRFLRKTSIDELPQLFNILRGEMSFIGPRPLLTNYLPYYTDVEMKRHSVLPGITGWAQVNGRNSISWEAKFKYDLEYVDKVSFKLDLLIGMLTIYKILTMADIERVHIIDFDIERRSAGNI